MADPKSVRVHVVDGDASWDVAFDICDQGYGWPFGLNAANDAIRKLGLKCPRSKSPKTVGADVYAQRVSNGKIVEARIWSGMIPLPLVDMTEEEFRAERKLLLEGVPAEFIEYIINESWGRGHSSGYEEVINYVKGMVGDLMPIIRDYTKRILKK